MGNLASVLQWNCSNCKTINPTESLNCIKCGNVRKIFPAASSNHHGVPQQNNNSSKFYTDGIVADSTDPEDSPPVSLTKHPSTNSNNNLQSYVEISSGSG